MSLVSVKRQLSADLERFSSRKKTFKNPRNSHQILSVRHLGDVTPNTRDNTRLRFRGNTASSSPGQSRPLSESTEHKNAFLRSSERPRTDATIPVTPPSSRQNIRVTSSQQFLRNTGKNTNNEVTKLCFSRNFSTALNNPSNGRFWSGEQLPDRQRVPGFEILSGDLFPEDLPIGTLCYASSKGPGSSFQVAVRRKRPSVRIVVNVPRIDVGETAIVFPYKHGNIRILNPRYTGRKALEES